MLLQLWAGWDLSLSPRKGPGRIPSALTNSPLQESGVCAVYTGAKPQQRKNRSAPALAVNRADMNPPPLSSPQLCSYPDELLFSSPAGFFQLSVPGGAHTEQMTCALTLKAYSSHVSVFVLISSAQKAR